jgi:hypothetical protein
MRQEPQQLEPLGVSVAKAHRMIGGADVISRSSFYEAVRRGDIQSIRFGDRIIILLAPLRRKFGVENEPV